MTTMPPVFGPPLPPVVDPLFPPTFGPPIPPGGIDPMLGGSLGIGRSGLSGLGSIPGVGSLPYTRPMTLASQVPVGVGQQAARGALGLMPAADDAARGLLSRLPALPSGTPLVPKGAMLRGGLYGLAGQVGSSLIDATDIGGQNSNVEQALQGAAIGAGTGAGVGLLGGPFAPVTVPTGAAIGGVVGGIAGVVSNFFGGGDDKPDPAEREETLATAIQEAGLDDFTTAQILDTYEASLAFAAAEEDDDLREQKETLALQQAEAMVLQAIGQRQQLSAGMGGPDLMALQAQAQEVFAPLAQSIRDTGSAYATAMGGLRDQLPPEYQAIADSMVVREVTSSNRLADAYSAQAALTPVVQRLTQYQQDQAALANQMWQQALASQMAGGGGATDVSAMLQPTG